MAESMSEQIFSIACALSKADESEKSMLRMICTAQEESLVRALKEGVAKEDCESAFICAASWLAAAAAGRGGAGGWELAKCYFYHSSGFKSFGNGLGYVSPSNVSVSSFLG